MCLTFCDPMNCSLPDTSVHGIFQESILERVPFPSPGYLSNQGIKPRSPELQADSLPVEPPGKPYLFLIPTPNLSFPVWLSKFGIILFNLSFPGGPDGKASACNAGDQGSIPGLGRSPGEVNSNPLQYSYMENPKDGGTW